MRIGPKVPGSAPLCAAPAQPPRAHLLLGCWAHGQAPLQGPAGSRALQLDSSFMLRPQIRPPVRPPAVPLSANLLLCFLGSCSQVSQSCLTSSKLRNCSLALSSPPLSTPVLPRGLWRQSPTPHTYCTVPGTFNSTPTTCHPHRDKAAKSHMVSDTQTDGPTTPRPCCRVCLNHAIQTQSHTGPRHRLPSPHPLLLTAQLVPWALAVLLMTRGSLLG